MLFPNILQNVSHEVCFVFSYAGLIRLYRTYHIEIFNNIRISDDVYLVVERILNSTFFKTSIVKIMYSIDSMEPSCSHLPTSELLSTPLRTAFVTPKESITPPSQLESTLSLSLEHVPTITMESSRQSLKMDLDELLRLLSLQGKRSKMVQAELDLLLEDIDDLSSISSESGSSVGSDFSLEEPTGQTMLHIQ